MNDFNKDFIQYSDEKVKKEKKNIAYYLSTRIVVYILLIFFAIFFAWYAIFISTHAYYKVDGASMMPTLNAQITDEELQSLLPEMLQELSYDAVYIDKTATVSVFDIVVIQESNGKNIIKRLMATAGDWITIAKAVGDDNEEHLYFYRIADGELDTTSDEEARLEENGENGYSIYSHDDWDEYREVSSASASGKEHVYEKNFYNKFLSYYFANPNGENLPYNYYVSSDGLVYVQVPEGMCFYMGDNRGHSTDAREDGFVDVSTIQGKVDIIVYDYNFVNRLWEVIKFYFSEIEKFFAR